MVKFLIHLFLKITANLLSNVTFTRFLLNKIQISRGLGPKIKGDNSELRWIIHEWLKLEFYVLLYLHIFSAKDNPDISTTFFAPLVFFISYPSSIFVLWISFFANNYNKFIHLLVYLFFLSIGNPFRARIEGQ